MTIIQTSTEGLRCPNCAGSLTDVPEGMTPMHIFLPKTGRVIVEDKHLPFVSCNGCEFIGTLDGRKYGTD